jgi:hypothetical protein
MKVIIAMDSFKGTLASYEACEIIAAAISECTPDARLVIKPMADGGEGTARAMIKAANGQWIRQTVMGPLPDMQVEAGFAWFSHDRTAPRRDWRVTLCQIWAFMNVILRLANITSYLYVLMASVLTLMGAYKPHILSV